MSLQETDSSSPINKVIFLQRIIKFTCRRPKEAPLLATVNTLWQATLQDEWQTTAIIFHNILEKDKVVSTTSASTASSTLSLQQRRQQNFSRSSGGRSDLFKDLPETHPLELLFRRALKERITWIVRAFVNGGHDVQSARPAYGFNHPLWFCTVSRLNSPNVGRGDSTSQKIERKTEVLRILANAGADVDACEGNGKTALFAAIEFCTPEERLPLTKFFLEELGADITKAQNAKTKDTIMHLAINLCDVNLVEYLVNRYSTLLEENESNSEKKQKFVQALDFLLNSADTDGVTPLITICQGSVEERSSNSASAVASASSSSPHLQMLKIFFSNPKIGSKVDVEAEWNRTKIPRTALLVALYDSPGMKSNNNLEVIKFLLTRCGVKTKYTSTTPPREQPIDVLASVKRFTEEEKKEIAALL